MPRATLPNGIGIEYETYGDRADPAILLIAGFGAQMLTWDAEFCLGLADAGRFVVRFDNRDCGRSTTFDRFPVDLATLVAAATAGDVDAVRAMAPYRLADMADDAAALAVDLDLGAVHVVGSSMGGMIAQLLAVRHPDLTATLTSMMSSTGSPEVGASTPEAMAALMRPAPVERDAAITQAVESARVWSSRRWFDEDEARALATASWDRGLHPAGTARHLAALLATGSIEDDLARLDVPTLVIHGSDDTLIDVSGGRRTADVVPGARFLLVPDMGHDRPRPLWPVLWDAILAHTDTSGPG